MLSAIKCHAHLNDNGNPIVYPIIDASSFDLGPNSPGFTKGGEDDVYNLREADGSVVTEWPLYAPPPNDTPRNVITFGFDVNATTTGNPPSFFFLIITQELDPADLTNVDSNNTITALNDALTNEVPNTGLRCTNAVNNGGILEYTIQVQGGAAIGQFGYRNVTWHAKDSFDTDIGAEVTLRIEALKSGAFDRTSCAYNVHLDIPGVADPPNPDLVNPPPTGDNALQDAQVEGEILWAGETIPIFRTGTFLIPPCNLLVGEGNDWQYRFRYVSTPESSSACGPGEAPEPRVLLEMDYDPAFFAGYTPPVIPILDAFVGVQLFSIDLTQDQCCAPIETPLIVMVSMLSNVDPQIQDPAELNQNQLKVTITDPDGEFVNAIPLDGQSAINTNLYESVVIRDNTTLVSGFPISSEDNDIFGQTDNPGNSTPTFNNNDNYQTVNLGDLTFNAEKFGRYSVDVEYVNTCGFEKTATTCIDVCNSFAIKILSDCGKVEVVNLLPSGSLASNTLWFQLEAYDLDTRKWELLEMNPGGQFGDYFIPVPPGQSKTVSLQEQTFFRTFVVEGDPDQSSETQQDSDSNYFVPIAEEEPIDPKKERTFLNDCKLQNCYTDLTRKFLCFDEKDCDEITFQRFLGQYNAFMALYTEIMSHVNRFRNYDVYFDLQHKNNDILEVSEMVERALKICDNCGTKDSFGNTVKEVDCGCG